jgi:hypothetical protein
VDYPCIHGSQTAIKGSTAKEKRPKSTAADFSKEFQSLTASIVVLGEDNQVIARNLLSIRDEEAQLRKMFWIRVIIS